MAAKRMTEVATLAAGLALAAPAVGQIYNRSAPPATAPMESLNTLAAAPVNHFLGTVGTSNRSHHWFTMRTTSNRTVRVYTSGSTN